jgi:nickel-dependent lactate racemase
MNYRIPYGRSELTFTLPDALHADWIAPRAVPAVPEPLACVAAALAAPVGNRRLDSLAGIRSVAIAVNDKTRPVPHQHLLPPLLARLAELGLPSAAITFVVAVGTHAPMTRAEFSAILPPEVLDRYRVVSHDCDAPDLVDLGATARGSAVKVNRRFYEADLRIAVGNIEPHQFAGFSGGVKTAAIGLGGRAGIAANHALLLLPASRIGEYETNPARQDIEEMGAKIGVHFALNAILNPHREIVHVLFGAPTAVMRAGIPLARQVCQVAVPGRYDLIVASPGGHPKDLTVYQAQKAFAHATLIMRPGGTVIVCAACPEGSGSPVYEEWMRLGPRSHTGVIAQFQREGFRIGPHKAFQIARDAVQVNLRWLSDMEPDLAALLLLNPISDLQSAVDAALAELGPAARVGILPLANATIPALVDAASI